MGSYGVGGGGTVLVLVREFFVALFVMQMTTTIYLYGMHQSLVAFNDLI
jgi:hypothetical protein